ncbi:MAG: large repetitive protein [Pyrinomonadaceae bacterium]|nr:large repetitive protein [Pyrinomonadaceae bacterium]
MSRPPFAPNPLAKLKITSSTTRRRPLLRWLAAGGTARRAGAFLALFALFITIFYTGAPSSAASPGAAAGASLPSVARQPHGTGASALSLAMFQFPVSSLDTYAADCSTPKTDFNLGETVCVRATFPASFFFFRSITFVDPDNHILGSDFLTSSGQTSLFTLPGTATSVVGGDIVDNRGTWRIDLRSAVGSRSAVSFFDVHEPPRPRADLQISAVAADDTVASGATVPVKIYVRNAGPDAASNIDVTLPTAPGLSLQSFTQGTSPDCGSVCNVASLPRGGIVTFLAVYQVTAAAGAHLNGVATVASATTDPRPFSNSDSFGILVLQESSGTQTCALTPPAPITVNGSLIPDPNDPTEMLYGAFVNYTVDAVGASCDPVQCDTPSGSLFPVGTTNVLCTAASGDFTSFPVTVIDTRSFQITLNGANPMAVECNSIPPFADPGATTNRPGVTPTATSTVNPNAPGSYTITYTATYNNGTPADTSDDITATPVVRTVNVEDDSPPHITLNGDNPLTDEVETEVITVECHVPFVDPGATAIDACDGPSVVSINSNVDPNTVGTYTIVYSATDNHGTPADTTDDLVASITRTVHVVDTIDPSISLNGGHTLTVECHSAFNDPGATATDSCAGDLTSAIQVSGTVDPNTVGTYTLTYTVSDASGNDDTEVRTVNVVDTTAPVITLNGSNPTVVECHTSYTDAGATANDACGGAVPIATSGSVNVNTPGAYTITYTATDGTNTRTATRTVNVVDTTAPVISCPANIVVNLPANTAATSVPVNFNVTATDSCSTAVNVVTSHASGASFPVGTTTVNATATDPSGNASSCSFTVSVHYLFTGFFSPISNLPVVNTVKAGSAIPIKFSLSGNKGLDIFAVDFPASGTIACNSNDPAVDLSEIDTPGNSGLSYDAGSGQYQYNWKTLKAWEGTCRQLVVKLNDGTEHRANFKFK